MKQTQEVDLFEICRLIKIEMKQSADSFVSIGYWLKEIKSRELYRTTGHKDIWEFAKAQFGFSKSTASRFMAINDRFSIGGNSPELMDRYSELSSSQLSEMLTLSDSQIDQVSAGTTVREIRAMKPKREEKAEQVKVSEEDYKEVRQPVATSQQTIREIKTESVEYVNPIPVLPLYEKWHRRVPLGKLDCDEKEIHEGDILESQTDFPSGIFHVVWHRMSAAFKAVQPECVKEDKTAMDNIWCIPVEKWGQTRIIGSIYDTEKGETK